MSDEAPTATAPGSHPTEPQTDAMVVDGTTTTSVEDKQDKPSGETTDQANGEAADSKDAGSAGPSSAANAADQDTEMGGTDAAAEEAHGNGTPADKKPRRKSSGVPEHKTKKTLKNKKSVKEFHTNAQPGELYLCRLKGHPAWPAIVAADDMLPEAISSKRPVTTMSPDGTWKRPEYAPGGKRHHERTFAVLFLHTNEFAWVAAGDLQPLSVEDCKNVSEKSKSKALIAAYDEAAQGRDLAYYKGVLNEHADAVAEEEQFQAEREAEKARKADKKAKRKSDAAAAVDNDDMDVDGGETKPKGKKRKKDAAEGDGNEKPAKTPKTTKLKLSTPKTPATGEKSAKKKDSKSTGKKQSAKLAESDDADTPAPEKELSAEEKHAKREQEVKYCRHKLQRGLLTRDNVPSDEEVKTMSTYLKKLEDYPELEASIIRATKIHKVLRAMIKLQTIPRDEEYEFKKRSHELLAKWNKVLAADDKTEDKAEDKAEEKNEDKSEDKAEDKVEPTKDAAATINGESKSVQEGPKVDSSKAAAESNATPKDPIGTKTEGEKEADSEKPATEAKTEEPDVSNAPAEEYKPPVEPESAAEATATS